MYFMYYIYYKIHAILLRDVLIGGKVVFVLLTKLHKVEHREPNKNLYCICGIRKQNCKLRNCNVSENVTDALHLLPG